jgi:hypothetical protein
MAVAFRSAIAGSNMSTALPTGTTTDDVVWAIVSDEDRPTWSVAFATGWNEVVDDALVNGGTGLSMAVAWAPKTSGTLLTNHVVTGGSIPRVSYICYSGVNTTTPIETSAYSEGNGAQVLTGITVTSAEVALIIFGHYNWTALTPPATWTERLDSAESHWMADKAVTAGATGSVTISGSNLWGGYIVGMLGAGGGGGPAYVAPDAQIIGQGATLQRSYSW